MSRRVFSHVPADGELRLLPSRYVPMSERKEEQLIDALAELLIEWLELHPDLLPVGPRPSKRSELLRKPSSTER
jgi:hypothetical protein